MTTSVQLKMRLENWGKCQKGGPSGGVMSAKGTRSPSMGGGGQCMTAVACEALRNAKHGLRGGNTRISNLDQHDANLVNKAWVKLPERPKMMLKLCYVDNSAPAYICRILKIPQRPAAEFIRELVEAEAHISKLLDL